MVSFFSGLSGRLPAASVDADAASEMRKELAYLRQQLRRTEKLETENERMRRALSFKKRSDWTLLSCEVIARDITGWWQTARVGKGREDGVRTNMAVISVAGLVGKILEVSERTADVLLLSDPMCRVSARIERSGAMGMLVGRGMPDKDRVLCRMDFISKRAWVRIGDEVVTSGYGGVFPPGLLVGYVEQVELDESGLYRHALVVPAENLSELREVFLVMESGGAL